MNGFSIRTYFDKYCFVVLLRHKEAQECGLEVLPTEVIIQDRNDCCKKSKALLAGQSFINRDNIVMLVKDGKVRLFDKTKVSFVK